MDKELQRVQKFIKAVFKQNRYFYGEPGSAKNLAHDLQNTLYEFADIGQMASPKIGAELQELSRLDMVKALDSCDSKVFQQITEIATRLRNGDSNYFNKIAAGLKQLPPIGYDLIPDKLSPVQQVMEMVHEVYTLWMSPPKKSMWTLPAYQKHVASGKEPLKRQMKELTKRFWAVVRLVKNRDIHFCLPTMEQPKDVEDKIGEEIKRFPELNWTRL